MTNVLVVGSGLTGAATVAALRQSMPDNTNISVWDKARGAGGRMSTARCPGRESLTVDLGAQYITLTEEYKAKRQDLYNELLQAGVLAPLKGSIEGPNNFEKPGAEHFVTPKGVNSLVKYFLQKANANLLQNSLVTDVSFKMGSKVSVAATTETTNLTEDFDAVVITMPVPQILQLQGSISAAINSNPDILSSLQSVSYSSRLALGLFFNPTEDSSLPWVAKYVADNPCVRYIAQDQLKRGVDTSAGFSLAVHTSVPYGLAHIDDSNETFTEEIVQQVRAVLPDMPGPILVKPQKWRYSQVHKCYPGAPGCVVVSTNPLVILAGDAFSKSTFDGCLDSAEAVNKIIGWMMPIDQAARDSKV